jgi:hypothetical protein
MKLHTAIKYLKEIHRRVSEVGGVLVTPGHSYDSVIFEEIWVFGSTIKGSIEPNDLDILIRLKGNGEHRSLAKGAIRDERYFRLTGYSYPMDSERTAYIWLTRNMRKVSRHHFEDEKGLGIDVMKMIYPRFELDLPSVSQAQVLSRVLA